MPTFVVNDFMYSASRRGPFKLYVFDEYGRYGRGVWFDLPPLKHPGEMIEASEALDRATKAFNEVLEVRVTTAMDELVFHAIGKAVLYGDTFWEDIFKRPIEVTPEEQ
jgi:hypothetical protein